MSTTSFGSRSGNSSSSKRSKKIKKEIADKCAKIEHCLAQNPIDLWELRELALTKGGFINADLRRQAWAKLVGLNDLTEAEQPLQQDSSLCSSDPTPTTNHNNNHHPNDKAYDYSIGMEEEKKDDPEVDLIRRDVGRSVVFRYRFHEEPVGKDDETVKASTSLQQLAAKTDSDSVNTTPSGQSSDSSRDNKAAPAFASTRLAWVLERTLAHPVGTKWYYYQGFHDLAGVLLHTLDYRTDITVRLLRKICVSHLRDAVRENFRNLTWVLQSMVMPLLTQVEPIVAQVLLQLHAAEVSNLCLPWWITWFTHDIYSPTLAARLIDAFLASHSLFPFYVAIALIVHPITRDELIETYNMYQDDAALFVMLQRIPRKLVADDQIEAEVDGSKLIPVQEVLEDAIAIMQKFPPRSLLQLIPNESRRQVLERASTISLFKAPCSWSMASTLVNTTTWLQPRQVPSATSGVSSSSIADSSRVNIRAKISSGVPLLMQSVQISTLYNQSSGSSGTSFGSRYRNKQFQMQYGSEQNRKRPLLRRVKITLRKVIRLIIQTFVAIMKEALAKFNHYMLLAQQQRQNNNDNNNNSNQQAHGNNNINRELEEVPNLNIVDPQ